MDGGPGSPGASLEKQNLLAPPHCTSPGPQSGVPRELQGIDDYLSAARNSRLSTGGAVLPKLSLKVSVAGLGMRDSRQGGRETGREAGRRGLAPKVSVSATGHT